MKKSTLPLDGLGTQFGEVIRQRRVARALSQESLAHLCGLHRTYISDLERGRKSASLNAIVALARALKIMPSTLIREAEDMQNG